MRRPKFTTETVPLSKLKPHPKNYKDHPPDQIDHIAASLRANGLYRNIVVAKDYTILAGHGVVLGAKAIGWKTIEVQRKRCAAGSTEALKILIGDNSIPDLAVRDDRLLTETLRSMVEDGDDLLGTGYDTMMLAALAMVTRQASEIEDFDAAAEWAGLGMPDHTPGDPGARCVVSFRSEKDREKFLKKLNIKDGDVLYKRGKVESFWWPPRPRNDLASLRLEAPKA